MSSSVVISASRLPVWTSANDKLLCDGKPFTVRGVNWFGTETETLCLHGLWSVSMDSVLDFIVSSGFNAVRLPFSLPFALNPTKMPSSINYASNPDLVGKNAGQVLDAAVKACGERGLLVMLDLHRINPASTTLPQVMWREAPETQLHQAWTNLATRYKGAWNVFAADLVNEPHGAATWGSGDVATDWRLAAQRLGETVLKANPRMLVFVEGVDRTTTGFNAFWGGTIEAALKFPVTLSVPNKVVYSPHIYGPDVFLQDYFKSPNFPANMPTVWQAHVGAVIAGQGAAVCVGEFGGHAVKGTPDYTWHLALIQWLKARGVGSFYWCVNPNSGDTGGLLKDDWKTPDTVKLTLLQGTPAPTQFPKRPVTGIASSPAVPPIVTPPSPSPQPPPSGGTSLGNGLSVKVTRDKQWKSSGGQDQFQFSLELVNTSTKTIPDVRLNIVLNPVGSKILTTWSMSHAQGSSTFGFPGWLVESGGLMPGARLVVGVVTTASSVSLAVSRDLEDTEAPAYYDDVEGEGEGKDVEGDDEGVEGEDVEVEDVEGDDVEGEGDDVEDDDEGDDEDEDEDEDGEDEDKDEGPSQQDPVV
jgi:endoglucanase